MERLTLTSLFLSLQWSNGARCGGSFRTLRGSQRGSLLEELFRAAGDGLPRT